MAKKKVEDAVKAVFTDFSKESNWVTGTVGHYTFEAKLFDSGSDYGIKNGRVSKLAISDPKVRKEKQNYDDSLVVSYDRGWDVRPKKEVKSYFNAVMELLENSPKRFENENS